MESVCTVKGVVLVAEASNPDMYGAIDLVMDKLEKQFIRLREKMKQHRNKKEEES